MKKISFSLIICSLFLLVGINKAKAQYGIYEFFVTIDNPNLPQSFLDSVTVTGTYIPVNTCGDNRSSSPITYNLPFGNGKPVAVKTMIPGAAQVASFFVSGVGKNAIPDRCLKAGSSLKLTFNFPAKTALNDTYKFDIKLCTNAPSGTTPSVAGRTQFCTTLSNNEVSKTKNTLAITVNSTLSK